MSEKLLLRAIFAAIAIVAFSTVAADPLDEIIQQEMDRLNTASGLRSVLNFKDSEYIQAEPDGTIYFPESVVEEIQKKTNATQTREVIRFLLAHEQAHQVQFETYGANAVSPTTSAPDRARQISRIRECQADILGAKYLMQSLDEIDQPDKASQKYVSETVREVLKIAFSLGEKEKDAAYPGPNGRRTAARLGLSRGTLEKIKQHIQHDIRFAGSARQLEIVLDVKPGQNVMDWSLRVAKRIVHYDNAILNSLSVVDARTSLEDPRAKSGFARFRLTYANSGGTAISVDMEIQCVTANQDDPDDTFRWEKRSVRNFVFTLQPGQTYDAAGQLAWDHGGDGNIARLIIPVKDDNALLSVEPTK
jgi:hypothetical protein